MRPGDLVAWSELPAAIKNEEEARALGVRAQQMCQKDPAQAMDLAREALRLHPAAVHAMRTPMFVQAERGENRESLRIADRVLELEPTDIASLCAKAKLELHLGKPATAAAAARKLVELKPDPEHFHVLAHALRTLGDVEGATAVLRMAELFAEMDAQYLRPLRELVTPKEGRAIRLNADAEPAPPGK